MIDARQLMAMYELTYGLFKDRLKGLTYEDSLVPAFEGGNCLNWVLGHVVTSRSRILSLLGLPPVWETETNQRFKRGSKPVTSEEDSYPLEEIVQALDQSQELLMELLRALSVDDLEVAIPDTGTPGLQTMGGALAFYHFHESYHAGQVDMILSAIKGKKSPLVGS